MTATKPEAVAEADLPSPRPETVAAADLPSSAESPRTPAYFTTKIPLTAEAIAGGIYFDGRGDYTLQKTAFAH